MDIERRLSDSEVSAVLKRAAEGTAQPGLTVAQVHEIAQDVGLSPAAVQRALAESASGVLRPAAIDRRLGAPVGVAKEVTLPGPMSDEAWDVLVSSLRATFAANGKESRSGVVREWRNGKLRIAVEPSGAGSRLRMSTLKEGALQWPMVGSVTAMTMAAMYAGSGSIAGAFGALVAIPALAAIGFAAWPFVSLPKWAQTRSDQFDTIAREASTLCDGPERRELPRGD